MVAGNGYDPAAAPLTFVSRFTAIVQRGRELPRIISQDMTLTKDYYWLIPDVTLIEAGVHVTVTEGTQVHSGVVILRAPHKQPGCLPSGGGKAVGKGHLCRADGTLSFSVVSHPGRAYHRGRGNRPSVRKNSEPVS